METNEMNMAEDPTGGPMGDGATQDYELASVGKRFGAYIIDAIIAQVAAVIVGGILGLIADPLAGVGFLVWLGYFLLKDALPFTDGQSVGKKVLNIRAVERETLEPLTNNWAKSAIRAVSILIPIVNIIDIIFIFNADNEHMRMGDKWADTIVIED